MDRLTVPMDRSAMMMDRSTGLRMNRNPRKKPRETPWMARGGIVPLVFELGRTDLRHSREYFRIVSDHLTLEATKFSQKLDELISGASSEDESEYYYDINDDQ